MSLILKTVNNTTFPLVLIYSANEGININLIYLLIKWELDFIFGNKWVYY